MEPIKSSMGMLSTRALLALSALLAVNLPLEAAEQELPRARALNLLRQNKVNEARKVLDSALNLNPNDADLLALKSFCSDSPLKWAEMAVSLNSKSDLAYMALGLAKHKQDGQGPAGLAELTKAIQLKPSSLAFNARGRTLLDDGSLDFHKALEDFRRAVQLDSKSVVSHLILGKTYFILGTSNADVKEREQSISRAIAEYSTAINLDSKCSDAYILRGQAFQELHRDGYLEDFNKAIELDPQQDAPDSELGVGFLIFPEGLPLISEFMGGRSSVANAYSLRAAAYKASKQYDKAIADFTCLTRSDPQPNISAYQERGEIYELLGKHQQAIADFSTVINSFDQLRIRHKKSAKEWEESTCRPLSKAYCDRAEANMGAGRDKDAMSDASRAIGLIEKYSLFSVPAAKAYFDRGTLYLLKKQYAKAIADYTKGLELNPLDAVALINRGSASFELKKYKDAEADYSKSIELGASGVDLLLVRGKCYTAMADFEKALADFNKANALADKAASARVLFARAEFYSKKGEHKKAIDDLTQITQVTRQNADVYAARAREYFCIGDYASAIGDYARIAFIRPHWLFVLLTPLALLVFFGKWVFRLKNRPK